MGVIDMNALLSKYYTKSIRLTPDGFSLFSADNGKILREDHPNTQNVLLTKQAPAFFHFEDAALQPVDVVVATTPPMLVPNEIYDEAKARDYLRMQYDITHIGQHFSDPIRHYQALYFLNQNEYDTINSMACVPHFVSELSILYRFLSEQGCPDAVMLSIDDTFADVLVMRQNEPSLINRTTRMENVDLLYYTLNCVMQFGLDAPTLFVQYFSKPNRKLNELLQQYHNHVVFI